MAGEQLIFEDIAEAIREKDGTTDLMTISQMPDRIRAIETGGGGGGEEEPEFIIDDPNSMYILYRCLNPEIGVQFKFSSNSSDARHRYDWGDGITEINQGGINGSWFSHKYAEPGYYIIKISRISTSATWTHGTTSSFISAFSSWPSTLHAYFGIGQAVIKIYTPGIFKATSRALMGMNSLKSYTLLWIGGTSYLWASTYSLGDIKIPPEITSIGTYAFQETGSAFFDFSDYTTVPSLSNTNAFYGTRDDKEIIVPDELYDNWIAATNWSSTTYNIVNRIVKKSQSKKYGGPGL